LCLRRAAPKLLEALLRGARNPGERRRLETMLADPEGEAAKAYLSERDVLDVLDDFSKSRPDPQEVMSALARLAPRLYSIASSPQAHPGEVHLCVGVVRYQQGSRNRRGVASTFLAERVPLGMPVPVFVQSAPHFRLPAPGVPIILVGPGTGVAPFRAFLEERRAHGGQGRNWLFFGDRQRASDFLYREQIAAWHADGFLTRLDLAFSRDQEEKVYVQDRMLAQARDLFAWLEEGAHLYVCGDAQRMAKDVDAVLHRIVAQEGSLGEDKAREYVEKLKREKRYARDVY
jgi:sulfite reductase (NADPH) flavoprotein alpha-component